MQITFRSNGSFEKQHDGKYAKVIDAQLTVSEFILGIESNRWQTQLENYKCAKQLERVKPSKEKYLPSIIPSILLTKYVAKSLWDGQERVTGILAYDIDGNFDTLSVKGLLIEESEPYYAFVSPNGGLKFAIKTDLDKLWRYKLVWGYYADVFDEILKDAGHTVRIDRSVSAPNSQCYVSYDPDVLYNPDAVVLPTQFIREPKPMPVRFDFKLDDTWEDRLLDGIAKQSGLQHNDRLRIITCCSILGFDKNKVCTLVDSVATAGHDRRANEMWDNCNMQCFTRDQAQSILYKLTKKG